MPRQVILIDVQLDAKHDTHVIVNPHEPDLPHHCCRLLSSRKSWLTATAGDVAMLRQGNDWIRHRIVQITLHRVFPTSCNGDVVESAQSWLDGL